MRKRNTLLKINEIVDGIYLYKRVNSLLCKLDWHSASELSQSIYKKSLFSKYDFRWTSVWFVSSSPNRFYVIMQRRNSQTGGKLVCHSPNKYNSITDTSHVIREENTRRFLLYSVMALFGISVKFVKPHTSTM